MTPASEPVPDGMHLDDADAPSQLSPRAWRGILVETVKRALHHRAPATAAAASFYGLLAFVPAIAAFGAAFGLLAGPDALDRQLEAFSDMVPASVLELMRGEASRFAHGPPGRLGFTAVFLSLVALGSATSAVRSLMEVLNTAYRVQETRHWTRKRGLAVLFAAGIALALVFDVALVIRSGDYLAREPDVVWPTVRLILRWVSLFAISGGALALLYRYGPDRPRARWRWVTPGSVVTALLGLLTSAGMSIYLVHFANYERTYGGLGSILGLAIWMWSAMIVVLVGAELNWAMECATSRVTDVSGRPVRGAAEL